MINLSSVTLRPKIATLVFTFALVMCSAAGCSWLRNDAEPPTHQWMGSDDVQYYSSGPEFKLSREAAALKAARAEEKPRKANRDVESGGLDTARSANRSLLNNDG